MHLPSPSLRIVTDEPGQRLLLDSEDVSVPPAVAAMMSGLVGAVARMAGAEDAEQWWRTRRLRVDRPEGVLVIDDVQMVRKEERRDTIALADVTAASVRTRYMPPANGRQKTPPFGPAHPRHVEILVSVRDGASAARVRTIHFAVEGMDTCEKVADVAFRLGAVLGLRFQRLVHADPRRVGIELAATGGPERQPLPVPEGPADLERGVVSAAAERTIAGQCLTGPVDAAAFPSDVRITRWAPGEEVRFDKPLQGMAFGCLPVALACFAAGPAAAYLIHDPMLTVIMTVVGLLFGALAVVGITMGLPRHTRIAWRAQDVSVGGALRKQRIRLDRVAGLEILCTRRFQDGRQHQLYHDYRCSVRADVRGERSLETSPVELVSTKAFKSDPETPYDAVLPIAMELAEALGVPWRVTDYA